MPKNNLEYRKALTQSKIVRKQLNEKVQKLIKDDEDLSLKTALVQWSTIGSIERQCDLLERLLKELTPD